MLENVLKAILHKANVNQPFTSHVYSLSLVKCICTTGSDVTSYSLY